jgi:hypothetical protein
MSSVARLNDFYGSFFKGAVSLSISPYLVALASGSLITDSHMPDEPKWATQSTKNGLLVCITLTIIPVLPVFTTITFGLALIGSAIAALFAVITYPVAAGLDCAIPENRGHYA